MYNCVKMLESGSKFVRPVSGSGSQIQCISGSGSQIQCISGSGSQIQCNSGSGSQILYNVFPDPDPKYNVFPDPDPRYNVCGSGTLADRQLVGGYGWEVGGNLTKCSPGTVQTSSWNYPNFIYHSLL